MIQWMLAIWSLVPLPFLKPVWTSGSSQLTYCWSLAWRILRITLLAWQLLWQLFMDKPQMGKPLQRIWSKIQVRLIPSHHFWIRLKGKAWVEHILQYRGQRTQLELLLSFADQRILGLEPQPSPYLNLTGETNISLPSIIPRPGTRQPEPLL